MLITTSDLNHDKFKELVSLQLFFAWLLNSHSHSDTNPQGQANHKNNSPDRHLGYMAMSTWTTSEWRVSTLSQRHVLYSIYRLVPRVDVLTITLVNVVLDIKDPLVESNP